MQAAMKGNWQKVGAKITVWLLLEILLNLVGLDTMADYSEYVFTQEQTVERKSLCCYVTLQKQYPAV